MLRPINYGIITVSSFCQSPDKNFCPKALPRVQQLMPRDGNVMAIHVSTKHSITILFSRKLQTQFLFNLQRNISDMSIVTYVIIVPQSFGDINNLSPFDNFVMID